MARALLFIFLAMAMWPSERAYSQTDPWAKYTVGYQSAGDFKFRILQGADLPGGDIRSGLADPALKGITAEDCLNLCVADRMCGAFTHNTEASVCFLKGGATQPSAFVGAISGIKYMGGSEQVTQADIDRENALSKEEKIAIQAQLNALGHKVGNPDGDFGPATRRGISSYQRVYRSPQTGYLTGEQLRMLQERKVYAETLVRLQGQDRTRVTRSATLSADQCEAVEAELRRVAADTFVAPAGDTATVGEPVRVDYEIARPKEKVALYLIATFDQPVRFDGPGFYGLTPGAKAPFDISHGKEKTRAVFPLYMSDTEYEGVFEFIPLSLGTTAVEVSLVAMTGCGERRAEIITGHNVVASPGAPEFVIVDEFAANRSERIYRSPNGERLLEELDGRFRILDAETGLQLGEYVGQEPRFSPTGRFVAAYVGDQLGIYDALDGKSIREVRASHVAWDNQDSFVVVGGAGRGLIWTYPSLGGDAGTITDPSCRVCSGVQTSTYRMDLENNLVIATGTLDVSVASITTAANYGPAWGDERDKLKYGSPEGFIAQLSGLVPVKRPKYWEMIERLQFTHIDVGAKDWGEYAPDPNLVKFVIDPIEVGSRLEVAVTEASVPGSNTQVLRGATVLAAAPATGDVFTRRLSENFGFEISADLSFVRDREPTVVTGKSPSSDYGELQRLKVDGDLYYDTGSLCMTEDTPNVICSREAAVWTVTSGSRSYSVAGGGDGGGSAGYSYSLLASVDSENPGEFGPISIVMPYEEVLNPGGGCAGECDFNLKLIADRYVMAWSTNHQRIEVYDRQTGQTRGYPAYRGDLMKEAYFSADLRSLLQVNSDGTFAIHGLDLGIEPENGWEFVYEEPDPTVLIFGRFSDDEIVIWSKDGHYDATYEGAYQVFLRFPGTEGLFTFDQFEPLLNRPGLLATVLDGGVMATPEQYDVPPIVDAEIWAEGKQATVTLRHRGGGNIASVSIFQDGKLTQTVRMPDTAPQLQINADLQPGVRWVSVVATGTNGLASTPLGRDIGTSDPDARSLAVFAIGVDEYSDPRLPRLGYAGKDAERFVQAVSAAAGTVYGGVQAQPADSSATRDAILARLDEIVASADRTRDLAIFYAGHGLQDGDGTYYLALPGTDPDNLAGTALPWAEISQRISQAQGRVTVFLDSCHSGDAGRDLFAMNDGAVDSILERAGNGVVVIAASKGREQAIERPELGGGLFTVALSAVLDTERERYDLNGNGAIEASELYRGVKSRVREASGGLQTPWMARNRMIGDFALF